MPIVLCLAVCRPYSVSPLLQFSLTASRDVWGVAQCDNKLFVVCRESDTIQVFGRDNKQQTYFTVAGLKYPRDIVSCTDTKQLYIADWSMSRWESGCVWRVSLDGQHVDKWLTNKSTSTTDWRPCSLSLTSRRLLQSARHITWQQFVVSVRISWSSTETHFTVKHGVRT